MQQRRYIVSENYMRSQQEIITKAQRDLGAISDAICTFQATGMVDEDTLLNLIDLAARDIRLALDALKIPF